MISILCGFPGFKRRNYSSTHCCQLGFQVLQASDPSNAASLSSTNGCLANLHQRIAPGVPGQKSHRNRYQQENITNIYKYDFFQSPFWTSRKILCSQRLLTEDLQRLSHSGRDSGRDFFGARFSLIFRHSCSQGYNLFTVESWETKLRSLTVIPLFHLTAGTLVHIHVLVIHIVLITNCVITHHKIQKQGNQNTSGRRWLGSKEGVCIPK